MSARTRVRSADEHEVRGIRHRGARPGDGDRVLLERLAERLEMLARELAELIKKKHPSMREGNLAGLRETGATADQTCTRDAVVRRAKRRSQRRGWTFAQRAAKRVDRGNFERRVVRQIRQQRGKRPREHRFASSRRTCHEHVVSTRGCDLEGSLGLCLSTNCREVRFGRCSCGRHVTNARDQRCVAAQIVDASLERRRAEHLDTLGKRGFRCVLNWHDEPPNSCSSKASRHRQDACHRAE